MLLDPERYPTIRIPVRHGMAPLHLTPAHDDDFEFVRLVHREAMYDSLSRTMGWQDEAQLEWLTAEWKAEEVWLLWSGGRRAGFLQLKEDREGLFLNLLCLKTAFQRQGIGHLLLSYLLQVAGKERRPIRLHVLKGSAARRLYEHFGFEAVGENEHQDFFLWTPASGQSRPSRETEHPLASHENRPSRPNDSERNRREGRPRSGAEEGRGRAGEGRAHRATPRPVPVAPAAEQTGDEAPEAQKGSPRPSRPRRPRSTRQSAPATPAPPGVPTTEATASAEGTGAESPSKRPSRSRRNRRRGRGRKGGGEQTPPAQEGAPESPSEARVA